MSIIVDDDVGIVFGGFDVFFIGRSYMIFPTIKYIGKVIAPLIIISDDAAFDFYVFFGINKNLQIKQIHSRKR